MGGFFIYPLPNLPFLINQPNNIFASLNLEIWDAHLNSEKQESLSDGHTWPRPLPESVKTL